MKKWKDALVDFVARPGSLKGPTLRTEKARWEKLLQKQPALNPTGTFAKIQKDLGKVLKESIWKSEEGLENS